MKIRFKSLALCGAAAVLAAGCGGSGDGGADTKALTEKVAELEAKLESTTTTTVAPTTAAPITAAPTTAAPVATQPPTTAAPAPQALMPNVVCRNLQDAQDEIQSAGVFFSESFDATGAGRSQVVDSNWVVVSQDPAPGAPISEGTPNLGVVKIGEPAPC